MNCTKMKVMRKFSYSYRKGEQNPRHNCVIDRKKIQMIDKGNRKVCKEKTKFADTFGRVRISVISTSQQKGTPRTTTTLDQARDL